MNIRLLPLGLVSVISVLFSGPASAQEDPAADVYRRAQVQLSQIERDAQTLRTQALAELVGKEYAARRDFPPHTAEQVEGWFKESLESLKQSIVGLEADHAALLKGAPPMTADRFHAETYGRIGGALGTFWSLTCRVLAGHRYEPGGRVPMLSAVNLRAYGARLKAWEEGRAKLDRRSDRYAAALAALEAEVAAQETKTWADLAGPYRETAVRLRDARRRVAGELWLWQDVAFRRSVVKEDVHDAAQAAFRSRIMKTFAWGESGELRSVADQACLHFRQVSNFFDLDKEDRFGEIRTGPWTFSPGGFLCEPVEDLRRYDDRVPVQPATGTALEQLVRRLHARLKALESLSDRMKLLEQAMRERADRLDDRELLREKLAAWRAALDAYQALGVPTRDEESRRHDAEEELRRDEEQVAAKTAVLEKARAEVAALERDLFVRPPSDVVRKSSLNGKSAPSFAEAERRVRERIENARLNAGAANGKEILARHEAELTSLLAKRDALLAPSREKAQAAEKELGSAKATREKSAEALRKIPAAPDRSAELKARHAAAAAARAEAVATERLLSALLELGPVPAELPAFNADRQGPLLKACADARAAVAAAEGSLGSSIDRSLEDLRRDLGDYTALGLYQRQLTHHLLVLRRDGTIAARTALESAGGDPARDPIFDELVKLQKQLEKAIKGFDAVGKLYPERIDFLAEPGEAKLVGLDEIFRSTMDKVALVGKVLKKLKKSVEIVLKLEELHRRLTANDPGALAPALQLIGEMAGEVPVIGPMLEATIGWYADQAAASIQTIKSLQKAKIKEALERYFDDNRRAAPEKRLYTVDDLKEIVGDRLQNTEAATPELTRLSVFLQARRLMTLTGAKHRGDIGPRP